MYAQRWYRDEKSIALIMRRAQPERERKNIGTAMIRNWNAARLRVRFDANELVMGSRYGIRS
jgi:hypothetical protein